MLMKDGDIVLIADSQGVRDSYSATGIAVEPTAPLSVLVNRGTASASEVAFALLMPLADWKLSCKIQSTAKCLHSEALF